LKVDLFFLFEEFLFEFTLGFGVSDPKICSILLMNDFFSVLLLL